MHNQGTLIFGLVLCVWTFFMFIFIVLRREARLREIRAQQTPKQTSQTLQPLQLTHEEEEEILDAEVHQTTPTPSPALIIYKPGIEDNKEEEVFTTGTGSIRTLRHPDVDRYNWGFIVPIILCYALKWSGKKQKEIDTIDISLYPSGSDTTHMVLIYYDTNNDMWPELVPIEIFNNTL